ncbi:GerMN domain-containing protein [Syntrophus aciditrophicus]|uniref:Spore germination protein n=1 Tax=Syntrophus aciditrophicus (strain SB) TaxID=56780 RepID=Q2LUL5_SYNAS|nr:GerMN domain-containing protein [Syntrophus aciditrophicus]ABC77775.1 spore germination protein [Syntrophus aciditrophicus SB]OPY15461.1 MAG: Sporulation and spore germination [Syntrophus sp. PtaB.Bin075]
MATKKQKRITELKNKKKKKDTRRLILGVIGVAVFGFLVFFFITLFNVIYPPIGGRTGHEASREKFAAVLYFSDANERFLVPEKRYLVKGKTPDQQAGEIVKAILDGSKTGKVNTFPPEVKLRDLKIEKNQTAYVSFSKNLVQSHPGGSTSEMATVYSLTNSLTANIPEIKAVRILIEGREVDSLKGHISLKQPFSFNREYLAQNAKVQ